MKAWRDELYSLVIYTPGFVSYGPSNTPSHHDDIPARIPLPAVMDFTQLYKQSASLAAFSNGGHFLLAAVHDRLVVRRVDSFHITRTWLVDSPITHIGWSFDSELVLAACAKRGLVSVFKIRDENWNARIEAGAEGLATVEWSPDGRSILCFSEWGVRTSHPTHAHLIPIHSSASPSGPLQQPLQPTSSFPSTPIKVISPHTHIPAPSSFSGYCFRADGRYFLLAERHKSKDTIGLYDASDSYRMVRVSRISNLSSSKSTTTPAFSFAHLRFVIDIAFAGRQPPSCLGRVARGITWSTTAFRAMIHFYSTNYIYFPWRGLYRARSLLTRIQVSAFAIPLGTLLVPTLQ